MAKRLEVYKCQICGVIVEVMNSGGGSLVCCGQNMDRMTENSVDAATEKHVPVVTKGEGTVTVTVGDVAHPMEDAHYIQWIELLADDKIYRKYLKPGESPEATFNVTAENVTAREYCNLHGQWSAKS